jgi:hypothetical protein
LDHEIILRELNDIGVRGPVLTLIRNLLSNRSALVEIDKIKSDNKTQTLECLMEAI